MLVTLFCDASWCPNTFKGGWGAWVKSKRQTAGQAMSGHFNIKILSANEAELLGVVNALFVCVKDKFVKTGDKVLIQTDNMRVVHLAYGVWRFPVMSANETKAFEYLQELKKSYSLSLEGRHVKGHQSNDCPRNWVNNQCDRMAKAQMRRARRDLPNW